MKYGGQWLVVGRRVEKRVIEGIHEFVVGVWLERRVEEGNSEVVIGEEVVA